VGKKIDDHTNSEFSGHDVLEPSQSSGFDSFWSIAAVRFPPRDFLLA
jgi:hypothetical protein